MNAVVDLDSTVIEFAPGELRFLDGDYGSIALEGATHAARESLDAIVGAARRGTNRIEFRLLVTGYDPAPIELEDRHAGREGTAEGGVFAGEFRDALTSGEEASTSEEAG